MEIENIIRTIPVQDKNMEEIKKLPCFRIILANGDIILDSKKMRVCCRNVAKIGDTLVENSYHKWEVLHSSF